MLEEKESWNAINKLTSIIQVVIKWTNLVFIFLIQNGQQFVCKATLLSTKRLVYKTAVAELQV